MFRPLLLFLSLARPSAAGELPPATTSFHIIFAEGWDFSVAMDVLDPIEALVRKDYPRVRLQGIDTVPAYYAGKRFFLAASGGISRADVPPPADQRFWGEIPAIETARGFVYASTSPLADFLIGKIDEYGRDSSDENAFSPGMSGKSKAGFWTYEMGGRSFESAGALEAEPTVWNLTAALRYHLLVDSAPVTLTALGKPLGGPGRVKLALQNRLGEISGRALKLNLGRVGIPQEIGVAPDALLKIVAGEGFTLMAPAVEDLQTAWDSLVEYARRGPSAGGLSLIATNLKSEEQGPAIFERYHIEEIEGIKVAIMAFLPKSSQRFFSKRGLHYVVEDPAASASETVRELLTRRKADLVVAVAHQEDADEMKALDHVAGIDLWLGQGTYNVAPSRKVIVDLSNWSQQWHGRPALRPQLPHYGFDDIAVTFRRTDRGPELSRVEELPVQVTADMPDVPELAKVPDEINAYFTKPQLPLLPDPRALWPGAAPPKLFFDEPEFWNLAAAIVRKKTGAEIALLRINRLQGGVTGELGESFVSHWLSGGQGIKLALLPGRTIKELAKRIYSGEIPVLDGPAPRYKDEVRLAASGLDKHGRVSGASLSDSELYEVAVGDELLQLGDSLPELAHVIDPAPFRQDLSPLVLGELKRMRQDLERSAYEREIRLGCEGKTPVGLVWRINLRELSLMFADTQVQGNAPFTQVRDARVQATSQVLTSGAAKLFSELYWNRYRWDAGLSTDYGRVAIRPAGAAAIVNTVKDQILLETELRHRTFFLSKDSMRPSLGPFVNVAYDTQFTKLPGIPKRAAMRYKTGAKISDGKAVTEAYIGPAAQTDYSGPRPRTEYGYAAGLILDAAIPGSAMKVKADASYLDFSPARSDAASDLKRILDLTVKFNIPVLRDMALGPFVSYYRFEGKVVHATGYNILFGLSLGYARLWKPFY